MDYPLLNLLFGLGLIFTLVLNISLRVLLSKVRGPVWISRLSWVALGLGLVSFLYIEYLFLRFMTPAFNQQIALGLLVMGGLSALVTASLYQRVNPARFAGIMLGVQVLASLAGLVIAFGLNRSLVPFPQG